MLDGARILVAEDEALIGIDLADHLEGFGAQVVGPVATVSDAFRLIERQQLHAALVDFRLQDGDTTPLLKALAERKVPTVVYTGQRLSPDLKRDYPDLLVLRKPLPMHRLVAELADACRRMHVTPEACSGTLRAVWSEMARRLPIPNEVRLRRQAGPRS